MKTMRLKKLLLVLMTLFVSMTAGAVDVPFSVWDAANTTLYFTYGEAPAEGDSWTPEGGSAITVTDVRTGANCIDKHYFNNGSVINNCTKAVFESSFASVKPTNLSGWFNGFSKMITIEGIENLNTSEATDMSEMFNGCTKLATLDVSHFNTSKVTSMNGMFANCSVVVLDLSGFDTSNVTMMSQMFYQSRVDVLDLSSFDTSNVTMMSQMFYRCQGLQYLDLSSFNTSKVTTTSSMFYFCDKLERIVVSDAWDMSAVTSSTNMFYNCKALVGEEGTAFDDEAAKDVTKAHAGTGGYLTSNSLYDDAATTAKYNVLAAAGVSTFKLSGRTIKGGKWNTLCIPSNIADLSASALAGAKVKKLKKYTNDATSVTITFEDATSIEAGKPYLVKPTADITDPVFDFAGVAAGSTTVTGAEFKGTYQASTLTAPNKKQLFLQNDKFYYPGTSDATLNAFRAYFLVTADVPEAAASRGIEIDLDGDGISTGIDFIENKATGEVKVIYDLSGHRVANPTKGLYIVNGKKVVIK